MTTHTSTIGILKDLHGDFDVLCIQEWSNKNSSPTIIDSDGHTHLVFSYSGEDTDANFLASPLPKLDDTVPKYKSLIQQLRSLNVDINSKRAAVVIHSRWTNHIIGAPVVHPKLVVISLQLSTGPAHFVSLHLPHVSEANCDSMSEKLLNILALWIQARSDVLWIICSDTNSELGGMEENLAQKLSQHYDISQRREVYLSCLAGTRKLRDQRGSVLAGWLGALELVTPSLARASGFSHRHFVSGTLSTKDHIFCHFPKNQRVEICESGVDNTITP